MPEQRGVTKDQGVFSRGQGTNLVNPITSLCPDWQQCWNGPSSWELLLQHLMALPHSGILGKPLLLPHGPVFRTWWVLSFLVACSTKPERSPVQWEGLVFRTPGAERVGVNGGESSSCRKRWETLMDKGRPLCSGHMAICVPFQGMWTETGLQNLSTEVCERLGLGSSDFHASCFTLLFAYSNVDHCVP